MIEIDLIDDAPQVEPIEEGGLVRLKTLSKEGGRCECTFDGKSIPTEVSAQVRSSFGKQTNNYLVHERTLSEPGHYVIRSWTRRGADRTFYLELKRGETAVTVVIGSKSTPCAWVVGDEVVTSKGTEVSFEVVDE